MRAALLGTAAIFAALLLGGCGGSGSSNASPPPKLPASLAARFRDNPGASSGLHDRGVLNHGYPVKVHDVWFTGPDGDRVQGYLMVPPGKGPFAGVVMVPGSGATRSAWLFPGLDLASRGAVVLSLSTRFIQQQNAPGGLAGIFSFRGGFTESVLDVRHALDLLAKRSDVDPKRLGLLGHSLGGMVAGVVAGVDPRLAAVDLAAPAEHAHFNPPLAPDVQRQAGTLLRSIDPTKYLPYAHGAVLLALAKHDSVIPRSEYDAFTHAAPKGTTVHWYDTTHYLDGTTVSNMLDWLADELDLGPVPAYARKARGS